MPTKLTTRAEWAPYLALFGELDKALRGAAWFKQGWVTEFRHVEAGNRVIFRLYKQSWYDGAIYFKTRLTNTDLDKGLIRIGLHVETNMRQHHINRVTFDKLLLEQGDSLITSWPGYMVTPAHHQKPLHTWIPFTKGNLVAGLEAEFVRLQQLEPVIEQAITGDKTA